MGRDDISSGQVRPCWFIDLEELGKQLSERRGGDPYRTSVEVLSRLLESDQHYGLRKVEEPSEVDS